ncbi:MltR family transcriptional regulator [Vibrio maerlii]|uniref:MltR family transcriptional regulator n=1 Tax=Vibrio maerlii TaxID=2231648 RepID=UPI001F141FE2|nr:MltR family transcriptional regulator [Vibrio maerlii]
MMVQSRLNESIHLPNENELLEVISQADNASSVINAAYHALDDAVGALTQRLFAHNDCAIQFVVDPLMSNDGPLGDMIVRSKLLLGLGMIPKENYEDIECFVRLKDWLEKQENKVIDFTQPVLLTELRTVQAIKRCMPIEYDPSMISGLSDSMLKMFIERHNQKVKSTIVIAITDIVSQLRSTEPYNPS